MAEAIVVSHWRDADLRDAHERARDVCGNLVSEIVRRRTNGGGSFLIAPDGSKKGWLASDEAEAERDKYVEWLRDNLGTGLAWVYLTFGGEDHRAVVLSHGDADLDEEEAQNG